MRQWDAAQEPATIVALNTDQTYAIQFDDASTGADGFEARAELAYMAPFHSETPQDARTLAPLKAGDRVEAPLRSSATLQPGRIHAVYRYALAAAVEAIQSQSVASAGSRSVGGNGDHNGRFMPGKITRFCGDGTYDVEFDNGDTAHAVKEDAIRAHPSYRAQGLLLSSRGGAVANAIVNAAAAAGGEGADGGVTGDGTVASAVTGGAPSGGGDDGTVQGGEMAQAMTYEVQFDEAGDLEDPEQIARELLWPVTLVTPPTPAANDNGTVTDTTGNTGNSEKKDDSAVTWTYLVTPKGSERVFQVASAELSLVLQAGDKVRALSPFFDEVSTSVHQHQHLPPHCCSPLAALRSSVHTTTPICAVSVGTVPDREDCQGEQAPARRRAELV
jgi:hypothetical protein